MRNLLGLSVLLLIGISCNKKTETAVVEPIDSSGIFVDEQNVTDSTLAATTACYMEAIGKDSLFAQIDNNLGTISGKLFYKNFEKDSSSGDISGFQDGDTLKVDYVFQAEGTNSTRQIWFLKKDGKLFEGIGEYDETGERYKVPTQVKFEGGHILLSADCQEVASRLKP